MTKKNQLAKEALSLLVDRCPRLAESCYWAGTSSIAIEELGHRESFDLDFHTRRALVDVHPILAEIQRAFGESFSLVQAPDAYGSGFSGVLRLPEGEEKARDLIDIAAVLEQRPKLEGAARRSLAEQDALLITERLHSWTDELIEEDLEAYPEVDPRDAGRARDLLLSWLKSEAEQT